MFRENRQRGPLPGYPSIISETYEGEYQRFPQRQNLRDKSSAIVEDLKSPPDDP
jgi:hypothetical protein